VQWSAGKTLFVPHPLTVQLPLAKCMAADSSPPPHKNTGQFPGRLRPRSSARYSLPIFKIIY
jgi:hypothetical protein